VNKRPRILKILNLMSCLMTKLLRQGNAQKFTEKLK